jgi:hypothetical protein
MTPMSEPFWTRWHFNIFVVLSAVDVQTFCTDQDQVKDIEPDVEPDLDSFVLFLKIDRILERFCYWCENYRSLT